MERFNEIFRKNITTQRLELRVLSPTVSNAQMIWDVLQHENPDEYRYMYHSVSHKSFLPESVDETLAVMQRDANFRNGVAWYIFHQGKLVGYQRVHFIENSDTIQCASVWFVKSARHQGFNHEVHDKIEQLAFLALGANRVCRQAMAGNTASVNSIKNSGYHLDGIDRQSNRMPDGTYMDHLMFSKLKSEYNN